MAEDLRAGLYFLRIALGSARKIKGWYYRAKALLKEGVFAHRLSLVSEVIALLVTEIKRVGQMSRFAFAYLLICRFQTFADFKQEIDYERDRH